MKRDSRAAGGPTSPILPATPTLFALLDKVEMPWKEVANIDNNGIHRFVRQKQRFIATAWPDPLLIQLEAVDCDTDTRIRPTFMALPPSLLDLSISHVPLHVADERPVGEWNLSRVHQKIPDCFS